MGSVAMLAVSRRPINAEAADCLYNWGISFVQTCSNPLDDWRTDFVLLDGNATDFSATTLMGDAYYDGMAVVLDGIDDMVAVRGDVPRTYPADGTFSVSMWFTRRDCTTGLSGEFEQLYFHNSEHMGSGSSSEISIFIGCSTRGLGSSLTGDIIRTVIVDEGGQTATFDWSVSAERSNGLVVRFHFTFLSVHVLIFRTRFHVHVYTVFLLQCVPCRPPLMPRRPSTRTRTGATWCSRSTARPTATPTRSVLLTHSNKLVTYSYILNVDRSPSSSMAHRFARSDFPPTHAVQSPVPQIISRTTAAGGRPSARGRCSSARRSAPSQWCVRLRLCQ